MLIPTTIVNDLRKHKTPSEINTLQKACALGDTIFNKMLSEIKEGISEKQLAAILEYKIKLHNADISFPTIIAFGANAAYPHHMPDDTKLEKDNFVLMDFGIRLNNYVSDMTRTVFFGKINKRQKHVYQTVLDAQEKAIDFINTKLAFNSISTSEVDKVARDHIISQGYPSMPHSLGHGIGVEVHEAPRLSPTSTEKLTNGMSFSIEPGIYLPEDLGVRIEDIFAIQKNKLVQLTKSSRELIAT